MNMRQIVLFLFTLVILLVQCKDDTIPPTEIEKFLANRYQSDKVVLTHNKVKTTTDGLSTYENFLLIELYNPKAIIETKFNSRILNNNCEEISNFLQDSIKFSTELDYLDLKIKIIDQKGFFVFKSEEVLERIYRRKY
jgi:hypothetical protein